MTPNDTIVLLKIMSATFLVLSLFQITITSLYVLIVPQSDVVNGRVQRGLLMGIASGILSIAFKVVTL